jgi:hypothetical protein
MELNKIVLLINHLVVNILRNSLIFLSLIILINGSCKKQSGKDLSLTVKEYQKLGMPDQKKIWSEKDYIKAIATLSNLKFSDPLSLPRKNSRKSGAVFSRFFNEENLSFVNDTTRSLRDRAYQIQYYSSFQKNLSRIYTDNLRREQYYSRELIDTYIFGLYVHDKMLELAGKIMNSKEQSDVRLQPGTRSVQNSYVQMVFIALGEQAKSDVYPVKDLHRLSTEVSRSLKKNFQWHGPEERKEITIQIQNIIEKSHSECIKDNYRKILKVFDDTK